MIHPENEARLVLSDTNDLNHASCVVTCWAGENAADVRIEHTGGTFALVVGRDWCQAGNELRFTADGPDLCPLLEVQSIPAGVDVCQAFNCEFGPVFTVAVDADHPTVTVDVLGSVAPADLNARYTVYWGTGYIPTKDVAGGTAVSNTYTANGSYLIRVQDQGTGEFGRPVWVFITKAVPPPPPATVTVAPPGAQSGAIGAPVSLQLTASAAGDPAATFTWAASGLPAGLTLDAATGLITGAPTAGQAATGVTVTATDAQADTAGAVTFPWTVTTAVGVRPVVDQSWTTGNTITPVTPVATDTDPAITSFAWSIMPTLPLGVSLNPYTGQISGTPAVPRLTTEYSLTATDNLGANASAAFRVSVS